MQISMFFLHYFTQMLQFLHESPFYVSSDSEYAIKYQLLRRKQIRFCRTGDSTGRKNDRGLFRVRGRKASHKRDNILRRRFFLLPF